MDNTMSILMLVLIIVVMYFLLIRPQKKKEKAINEMRNAIKAGDEIVTIGGICGKIVKTKDESLVIQVGADKVKFEIMRWAVSKVVSESSAPAPAAAEEEAPAKKPGRPKRMKAAAEAPAETQETPAEAPAETQETPAEAPAAEEAPVAEEEK